MNFFHKPLRSDALQSAFADLFNHSCCEDNQDADTSGHCDRIHSALRLPADRLNGIPQKLTFSDNFQLLDKDFLQTNSPSNTSMT